MPFLSTFLLLVFFTCLPATPLADGEKEWEFVKEIEGIRIDTREVPGAEIRQLRAEARVQSTVERLLHTYLKVENHMAWYPGCVVARSIRGDSAGTRIFYHRIDNPWPIQDRDYAFTVDTVSTEEPGGKWARYEKIDGLVPETKDCVRMRKFEGYWKFVPESDSIVAVTYVFDFDPGVGAPVAFINMSLSKIGRDMIQGLARGAKAMVVEQTMRNRK